jgi:hypothetical protein
MRESIGATFLIKIMVVFIVLYNALLAIAVNYAMVFRVKNQFINLLEQYEGCQGAKDEITNYISEVGYYRAANPSNRGYTIEAIPDTRGTYYKVITYIKFDFPMVSNYFMVPITGETKVLYGVYEDNYECNI